MATFCGAKGVRGSRARHQSLWPAAVGAFVFATLVLAQGAEAEAPPGHIGPESCALCHSVPGLEMELPSGEVRSVYVDPEGYRASVHGSLLQCTACHAEVQQYPHEDRSALRSDAREVPSLLRSYAVCGRCHEMQYLESLTSTHSTALTSGDPESAVCSDCHGAHYTETAKTAEVGLALGPAVSNCAPCHKDQFDGYRISVHGKALLDEGDTDAPACIDCHGDHAMPDAKDAPDFRRQAPYACASCHANKDLMTEHGLSTRILETYVADFHGTTSQLFTPQGGQAPEQAVCHDCHGNHAIASTVGADSPVLYERLTKVCEECHPGAPTDYPAAWLGHRDPTPEQAAPVFWIRVFYIFMWIVVVGALVVHVAFDNGRLILDTLEGGRRSHE